MRLSVVDGTIVGYAKGCTAGKVVAGVIDLQDEYWEEEEGASFEGGEDATAGLKAMGAKGVKQAAELRNMETVPTFNDLAIQTIHNGSNTFNFQFGIVAKSGIYWKPFCRR